MIMMMRTKMFVILNRLQKNKLMKFLTPLLKTMQIYLLLTPMKKILLLLESSTSRILSTMLLREIQLFITRMKTVRKRKEKIAKKMVLIKRKKKQKMKRKSKKKIKDSRDVKY